MEGTDYTITIKNATDLINRAGSNVGGAGGIAKAQGVQPKQTTQGEKKPAGSGAGKGKTPKKEKTKEELKDEARDKAVKMLSKRMEGQMYSAISWALTAPAAHGISLIEVRTGSKESQERTSYVYNNISSVVMQTASGAMAGASVAGGYGAAVGAVIGLASGIMSYATNLMWQKDTLSNQRQLDDVTRQLTTQRMTTSGSRYMNATQMF